MKPIWNNILPFWFLVLYMLSPVLVFGQTSNNIMFSKWQLDEGLPNNSVNAIEKDHLGFLWIATNDGLCRYDGPNVMNIYKMGEEGEPSTNTLQSNMIRSLLCDSQGYLWIGTRFGGLTRYLPAQNEWVTFRHDPQLPHSLSNDEVLTVYEDSKNRIWVGTENGLNLFDASTSTFKRFDLNLDNENWPKATAVLTVLEDQRGWIWAGTWSGGLHLILENEAGEFSTTQIRHFKTSPTQFDNNIWTLYEDDAGRFWIGNHGGGLLVMNLPSDASNQVDQQAWEPTFKRYFGDRQVDPFLESDGVQCIFQDRFMNIWVGTTHGLYRFPPDLLAFVDSEASKFTGQFDRFFTYTDDISSIIGNNIMDLYEDDQGLIWIATSNGLSQYNLYSNQFNNYRFPNKNLFLPFAPSLVVDSTNQIWVASSAYGIISYRMENGELVPIETDLNSYILGNRVSTIHSPDKRSLYVGTEEGVTFIDLKSYETQTYPIPNAIKSVVSDFFIKCIFVDRNGTIWLGTYIGLLRIDPGTKALSLFTPESQPSGAISDRSVNHIIQDKTGAIWVATYKGLNRVANPEREDLVFEQFMFNADDPQQGPMSNETMFLQEIKDYLYIGTTSGICRYNFSLGIFETFEASKYKYWIRGIEESKDGSIWISAIEGILNYNLEDQRVRIFDKKDGLKSTNFQQGCSTKDIENNIYFAFVNGITMFEPEDFIHNKVPPPVYFTEIETTSREGTTLTKGVLRDQIELRHTDYRISIQFAALNYNRADKNEFAYRLVGLEEKWNEGDFGTPIVYTNLEPETYRLEIRASNNEGVWNEEGAVLTIIQHPPFWESWWFRILLIGFVVSLIILIFIWYTNNIRKHNERLKTYNNSLSKEIAIRRKVEQQLNAYNKELKRSNNDLEQFAYAASHDLKEPIRVIGNFSGLLARRYKNKLDQNALEYIDFIQDGVFRMSNVINSLLTYSIVGRQDTVYQEIDLADLIKKKVTDLSQLIDDKKATVEIGKLPTIIGHKEQIGMVFFNLINNALKFNEADQPFVSIREESGDEANWKFSIQDNGIGIEEAYKEKIFELFKRLHGKREYEGTGIGLSLCQKIILRHGGTIWFESELGKGTTFYFTLKKDLTTTVRLRAEEEVEH